MSSGWENMKRTKHWTSPHKDIFQESLQATCTPQTKAFETCFIIFQSILHLSSRVASAVRGDPSKAWVHPIWQLEHECIKQHQQQPPQPQLRPPRPPTTTMTTTTTYYKDHVVLSVGSTGNTWQEYIGLIETRYPISDHASPIQAWICGVALSTASKNIFWNFGLHPKSLSW